ncbi:hypothetical protein PRIPAC_73883 [Pristionchus pacificus]|uniref:Uncharacterized protein n=1 Tax=Pristionchus pacificus TaxID=54126 RepID=A0A454XQ33_PRIPA|nr:hypothetical protein PRIPAC_73883 [Pristionchus pacificus]|eukprot:PDM80578.1 hypothetical protein PRIPAC_35581 [Pristionchus pacificus]
MPEIGAKVHVVAGVFFSISISASVLACALWNFQTHDPNDSLIYGAAVFSGLLLNIGILSCLIYGATRHIPGLMTPYVVCGSLHLAISAFLVGYFAVCTIYGIMLGNDLVEVYGFLIFSLLTYFWSWSVDVVRTERDKVSKLAGKHVPFINDDYI